MWSMSLVQIFYSIQPKPKLFFFNRMALSIITIDEIVQLNITERAQPRWNLKKQFLYCGPSIVSISPRIGCWAPPLGQEMPLSLRISWYPLFCFCLIMQHSLFLQMEEPTALMAGLSFTLHFNNVLFIWKLEHPNDRWCSGLFHQTREWGWAGRMEKWGNYCCC